MHSYLLDTHVFVWWLNGDRRLPKAVIDVIQNEDNHLFLSVASAWELSIKAQLNDDVKLKADVEEYFHQPGFEVLPIHLSHVAGVARLPWHHKDPFDRMLIAQAQAERLTLITADPKIWQYDLDCIPVKV